jgi:sugar O-acyltransferase (sialic acid O-acetyltransferase NeuD family)
MTDKVVVFGNSELAAINSFYLTHDSPYRVVGFTTDAAYVKEDHFRGLPVVPFEQVESIFPPSAHRMSILLGFRDVNRLRSKKYVEAIGKGFELISYISSKAIIWPGVEIGDNCHIHEGAVVQPFAKIGSDVVISAHGLVGHHSHIRDHCFLSAGSTILGGSVVEPYCVLGANATVLDGVTVARECIIGAGSLITKDTCERGVYMDKAAELLSKTSDEVGGLLTWSNDARRLPKRRSLDPC